MIERYIADLVRAAVLDALQPLTQQVAALAKQVEVPRAPPDSEWLTTAEVGLKLGVAAETVREWVHNGRLPATLMGRSWRVRHSDVVNFMARPTSDVDAGKVTSLAERLRRAGQQRTRGKP
ncbi:MAG: Helix-turn-helix domain [Pseudomonadota bacterium]|jgi:excisionase family DNA binding protein